jgi:hypothetical protein
LEKPVKTRLMFAHTTASTRQTRGKLAGTMRPVHAWKANIQLGNIQIARRAKMRANRPFAEILPGFLGGERLTSKAQGTSKMVRSCSYLVSDKPPRSSAAVPGAAEGVGGLPETHRTNACKRDSELIVFVVPGAIYRAPRRQ